MITAMTAPNEQERILELYYYNILDSAQEEDFNDIVQLASKICKVPISLISLIDSTRQWFKAKVGLQPDETTREVSFCAHAIAGDYDVFEIEDATKDIRFLDNPLVTGDPNIRFYAGIPLTTSKGHKLGTLCVIDSQPRQLDEEQQFALKVLANQVIKLAEKRLQNQSLYNYQKRLEQQAEMQNRILSIVAHDVRSPLVSLQGIIELSQDNLINDEMKLEMIEMWKKQLDNTMGLLTNLIDWGKIQACSNVLDSNAVNLYDIVQDEFIKYGITASEKGNQLQNNIDSSFLIYGDENVIRFIVRNTLTNANKFTEKGTISIAAKRNGNKTILTINDTGIGMSQEQLKNLQNTKKTSMVGLGTRNEKGSGLGFILIKDFIEMLNGKIDIASELGKGTTIRLELTA